MIKLKQILLEEIDDIPKILWHATSYDNLRDIWKEGLKLNRGEKVIYFTDKPDRSARFLLIRGIKHIISIPVDTKKLDKTKIKESFDHAQSFYDTRAWTYLEPIPSSKIMKNKILVYDLTDI